MRNKNNKQKKSLIFSTAVVITGCIATAVYVNQSMNTATDYKIDLSRMETTDEAKNSIVNDPELGSGASLARVSGQNVVNTNPQEQKNETGNKKENKEAVEEKPIKEQQAEHEQQTPEETIKETPMESVETASDSVIRPAPATDLSFDPENRMGWPLAGDVILNYSMDSTVYFATLMQYKYNPAILIGAKEGDHVSACARGQVVAIGQTAEQGQYVVMNLGDGYEVTYGQLENLQVKEGAIVSRGQVIGDVAKTTKYYSVEGDHVSLAVTKDGEPVDPLSLLE